MSSMELEVKILNIDKEGIINKIKKAGGKYIKYFRIFDWGYYFMYCWWGL